MQPKASHPLSSATPLAALLGRAGAELTDLAAAVEQLHPLVSAHAQQAAPATPTASAPAPKNLTPDDIQALQGIDHIEQKLRALAGFLSDLAKTAAPDWQLDAHQALAAITLSDLASRLAGNKTTQDAAAGDFELF
ncbi:hypothetical protein [Mesorhizobium sp. ANAO-SY3R2]|uniref:hypothetical protein n=1 Tax=Mesorhizobium sp. ANAO-SY3R2 TaxID=3166644 RepID=UPI00366CC033